MKNFNFYRVLSLCALYCMVSWAIAQAPTDYYSAAKGKSGKALKTALYGIVSSHTQRSYNQLWTDFKTTDVREDGKIWDMYSNATNYVPGGDAQGKNYSKEGDSYNREHSFPKSWFNDAYPMYTDLFHLYPTDGYVNNRRSNYPFGETDGERYQSKDGFSKLGSSTIDGYTGIVFEPADEYKGDFARTYFYMATAYEDKIASWSSPMLAGNSYPAYADWALTMLLRWAQEDPVSTKETARNNAVYSIQHNRNPYIDFPGLEQYVWGSKTSTAFNPDDFDSNISPDPSPTPTTVKAPTFSVASGVVADGTEVTIATATEGAYVYYTVNGGDLQTAYQTATITIHEATTIEAYAWFGEEKSDTVTAIYTLQGEAPIGNNVYGLVTDVAKLSAGQQLLIVCPTKNVAMASSYSNGSYRTYADVTINDGNTITTDVGESGKPIALTLGGAENAWTFYDATEQGYLALTTDGNKLFLSTTTGNSETQWSISITSDGVASIVNNAYNGRYIRYNFSSPRFACYKSGQTDVSLFALLTPTQIRQIEMSRQTPTIVYDMQGRVVCRANTFSDATGTLPSGIYIVNGKKILVK